MSDSHSSPSTQWFCHACQISFVGSLDLQDPECLNCHSSFVEELSSPHPAFNHQSFNSDSNGFFASIQDDSPPIPSTRQRYEQQQQEQQQHHNHQAPFINIIHPLINILSAPTIPDPPDHDRNHSSPYTSPPNRPTPTSSVSIGDFLAQHYSPQASASPTPFSFSSANNESNNQDDSNRPQPNSNASTSSRLTPQGVYTFAFGSRSLNSTRGDANTENSRSSHNTPPGERSGQSTRTPAEEGFSFGTGNPTHQPLTGILSLLQSAFGLATSSNTSENGRQASEASNDTRPRAAEPASDEQSNSLPGSQETPSDSSEDHATQDPRPNQPRPTPRSPRVNLEESHPLRQFINMLNTLSQSDSTINQNGINGFVINGGAGFGFATQFDLDQNNPFGQNLGDYVTSDTAMQDILNQLINMTGANGSRNPIPASESTIRSLRRFKFDSSLTTNDEPIECAICKDTFQVDDECMELPCQHYFHAEDCIMLWLKQNGSCPVCRYSLVNRENSEEPTSSNASASSTTTDEARNQNGSTDQPSPSSSRPDSTNNPTNAQDRPSYRSSHSSGWTSVGHWEFADQLDPQFDFD